MFDRSPIRIADYRRAETIRPKTNARFRADFHIADDLGASLSHVSRFMGTGERFWEGLIIAIAEAVFGHSPHVMNACQPHRRRQIPASATKTNHSQKNHFAQSVRRFTSADHDIQTNKPNRLKSNPRLIQSSKVECLAIKSNVKYAATQNQVGFSKIVAELFSYRCLQVRIIRN